MLMQNRTFPQKR